MQEVIWNRRRSLAQRDINSRIIRRKMASSLVNNEEDGVEEKSFPNDFRFQETTNTTGDLEERPTDIQRFYSGACVLVTGATGFMGKVLIEKLLRSCPDIAGVYMIVREKRGRSLERRINDLASSACFDRIKNERPDFHSKLHAVGGDMGEKALGISDEDRLMLQQQINIVFHVAATVRFDEHLKLAILQNVRGTRELLNLCKTFRNVKSIVYVSTAYSNCPSMQIDERFYEPHIPSDHAIHLAETLDISTIDHLSHKLMGAWPNTYSFTKALSEDIVKNHGQGFPIGVFKPSIVVCTYKEPTAGWIDNVYGPTGVLVAVNSGLLRTMQVNENTQANMVPCDMVVNALIVTARDVAEKRSVAEIPVFNYVLPKSNPLTWKRLQQIYLMEVIYTLPLKAIWYPILIFTSSEVLYYFLRFLLHFFPALIMDIGLWATNRSPRMIRVYHKLHKFTQVISYFATSEWEFKTENMEGMWNGLKENDKRLFHFDMDSVDWYRFTKDTCVGMRLNLLNDPPMTLPYARIHLRRLYILHRLVQCVLGIGAIWVSIQILPVIVAAIQTAVKYCCTKAVKRIIFSKAT